MSDSAIRAPATAADSPPSLAAAIGKLVGSGRELVADAADLVAAEAHVALQVMTALVVSAVCAAVLGVLAAAGVLAAIAMGMIERGFSGTAATGVVALVCALAAVWFVLRLRSLARRALFARSRQQLRGDA
ncbi:MAG TPA: hypothetical protein VH704_12505 [Casimicrobiaceae bacterium]|nr:hypothetical protein [Casimicrobiaceae bacterium]